MKHVTLLRVEELSPRTLPSVTHLIDPPDPPDTPVHVGHPGVLHTLPAHADAIDGLDGTVRGSLRPALGPIVIDEGLRYTLTGSGKLGGLDTFAVTGWLHGTGFIPKWHATGELKLTNAHGSITVRLQGPEQPGSSPLPGHFHFIVTVGTGAYKHFRDDGEVSLTVRTHGNATSFRLVFA